MCVCVYLEGVIETPIFPYAHTNTCLTSYPFGGWGLARTPSSSQSQCTGNSSTATVHAQLADALDKASRTYS